jgi:hypothetical protein
MSAKTNKPAAAKAKGRGIHSAYFAPAGPAAGAVNLAAPDLTRHPPRSPHTRLGGYVHLPRLIDKARAKAGGRIGDYHYPCPFDKRFFGFTGLNADVFLAQVKTGRSDSELLAYVNAKGRPKRHPSEIGAWSQWMEQLTPSSPEARTFFTEVHAKNAAHREDIVTWFDWLELDDFVTFGGKP